MATSDTKNFFHIVESESICSVSDFLKEASLNADLSLRAFVNQRDEQNQAALHIACSKLLPEITQILLEAGADPNVQDVEGRTPVYLLVVKLQDCNCDDCMKKAIRCLAALSYHGASLDIPNGSDITPLYLCAEYRIVNFAKSLLENGAALGTVKGRPMIEVIAEKIPAAMESVLDRALRMECSKTMYDPDFELVFDLSVILPPHITLSNQLHGSSNGNMNQVFPANQWFSENYEASEEMTFLKQILNYSGQDITTYRSLLKHPIVNVFTDIKWKSLEALYIFFLFMQVKVLLAYSAFICVTIFMDCPYDLYVQIQQGVNAINTHVQEQGIPGSAKFNATNIIDPDSLCEINIISKILSVFVSACTLCIFMKEMQHAMYDLRDYLKDIFNYVQLVGFISVLFTVIIAWDKNSFLYSLLYPVAAFGIAISWCQVFVQIGRLPSLAIYIEMFVKISVNFCYSLAIYSFLLIGFAMSFNILFPAKPRMHDLPLALVKVLTMLVGEMDYEDLFNDNLLSRGENKSDEAHPPLPHLFASRVWYVNFVVYITLVLMNLLVGLAVSDIQGIRKDAEIYVIKRRITYIAYLEKSLFEATAFIPNFVRKFLRENISVARPTNSKSVGCCIKPLFNPIELKGCKLPLRINNIKSCAFLSRESKSSIRHWLHTKAASNSVRRCRSDNHENSAGFRKMNRKASQTSFVGHQQIFVKDGNQSTDSDRLKRLEFNVQQMENKMNEVDLKLDIILKSLSKSD